MFLYVPKNVEVEDSASSFFLSDDAEHFAPHVLIIAERTAGHLCGSLCLRFTGDVVHNGVAEVFAKTGGAWFNLPPFIIWHEGNDGPDLSAGRSSRTDARIDWIVGEMNSGDTLSDTTSVLTATARYPMRRSSVSERGDQKLNITTRAVHFGKLRTAK